MVHPWPLLFIPERKDIPSDRKDIANRVKLTIDRLAEIFQ